MRAWDARTFSLVLTVPLPGSLECVAIHHRLAVCGGAGGGLHLLDLIGIDHWCAPSDAPVRPVEGVIEFYPSGLLHKFGFGDGDMLEDLREEHGLKVDRSDLLAAVVERLVVPRLDQRVETYTIGSMHNPIRARTVDGEEADLDSTLTPEVIEVPIAQIIEVARTLPTVDDEEDAW